MRGESRVSASIKPWPGIEGSGNTLPPDPRPYAPVPPPNRGGDEGGGSRVSAPAVFHCGLALHVIPGGGCNCDVTAKEKKVLEPLECGKRK